MFTFLDLEMTDTVLNDKVLTKGCYKIFWRFERIVAFIIEKIRYVEGYAIVTKIKCKCRKTVMDNQIKIAIPNKVNYSCVNLKVYWWVQYHRYFSNWVFFINE